MDDRLALVPREARRYQGEPAGIVTRSMAVALDALVVAAGLAGCWAGLNVVRFLAEPRDFQAMGTSLNGGVVTALVVSVAYLTGAWAGPGRTYGNRLMGLRVVDRQRRPLRPLRALLRALLCVGFPVGLIWSVPSTSRSSLQDVVLGTVVIYDWPPRHDVAEATGRPGLGEGDGARP